MQSHMTMHSGASVDVLTPGPLDVHDIAWGLAHQHRFNGHLQQPIDVATHSIALCALVPNKWRLRALLHDASEALLGDIVRPLKVQEAMAPYRLLERQWQEHIYAQFEIAPYSDEHLDPPGFSTLDLALTLHEAETCGTSAFARSVGAMYPDALYLDRYQRSRCTQPLLRRVDMPAEMMADTWCRAVFHHAGDTKVST